MCRKGAWAELAAGVTFMVRIQSRMPGYILTSDKIYRYFTVCAARESGELANFIARQYK